MSHKMIFAIGLPRSGGQSLQAALYHLTGREIWHSLGNLWDRLQPDHGGAVECFAPIAWLEDHYPGCYIIFNHREPTRWLESCRSVYSRSQENMWNHPLWRYPLDQFHAYRAEYNSRVTPHVIRLREEGRFLSQDFTAEPIWQPLCGLLQVPVPQIPFPNQDRMRARPPAARPVEEPDESWNLWGVW